MPAVSLCFFSSVSPLFPPLGLCLPIDKPSQCLPITNFSQKPQLWVHTQDTTMVWRSPTPPTKDCVLSLRPQIQCCRCFRTVRLSERSLSHWGDFSDLSLSKSFCFLVPILSSLLCHVHIKCSLARGIKKKQEGPARQ